MKCNYQLIADNVLDVTHLAYVHSSSIGASSITEFPATVEREERLVRLTRWIRDRAPPPLYKRAGGFPDNVDRWQIVEHVPPCYSVNFAGCKDAERRIDLMALSALTKPVHIKNATLHFSQNAVTLPKRTSATLFAYHRACSGSLCARFHLGVQMNRFPLISILTAAPLVGAVVLACLGRQTPFRSRSSRRAVGANAHPIDYGCDSDGSRS